MRYRAGTVQTHGRSRTPEHRTWAAMHQRCNNPNNQMWEHYGGRGISVDPRWDDFEQFLRDMGPRPDGHSIERRDNDGNYGPDNCYWADWFEQARNTSRSRKLTYLGETKTISDWARVTGIHKATIRERLTRMSVEEALTKPPAYPKNRQPRSQA